MDNKKKKYIGENLSVLSKDEKLKMLYEIIDTLSDNNITWLLYSARGLSINGD